MYGYEYDLKEFTLLDCIEMAVMKGEYAVINDGKLIGFMEEIN